MVKTNSKAREEEMANPITSPSNTHETSFANRMILCELATSRDCNDSDGSSGNEGRNYSSSVSDSSSGSDSSGNHKWARGEKLPGLITSTQSTSAVEEEEYMILQEKSRENIRLTRLSKSQSQLDELDGRLTQLATLAQLTGFAAAPDYFFVDLWFTAVQKKGLSAILMLVLTWMTSLALSAAGLGVALVYRSAFDWDNNFGNSIIIGVMGGIFTSWNIAQYASLAIQTTGHVNIWQHIRAIRTFGPSLTFCNLIGWALCFLVLTKMGSDRMLLKKVIIIPAPILLGIAIKTVGKLRYFQKHADSWLDGSLPQDAFAKRMEQETIVHGKALSCPFTAITCKVWVVHVVAPCICFFWTMGFVLALRLGYAAVDSLNDAPKILFQGMLFVLSLMAQAGCFALLSTWVHRSSGFFGYNHQMLVAFSLIYTLVSNTQVRLGMARMDNFYLRLFCSLLAPSVFLLFRHNRVEKFTTSEDNYDADCEDYEPWLVISYVGSIVGQNVSTVLVAGLSCLYSEMPMFALGTCPSGLWRQIALDSAGTWLADIVCYSRMMMQGRRMPLVYFFSVIDGFLTIAVILVVYMCTMIGLLTASASN